MSKRDYDAEIAARDSEIAALMDENAKLWLALYPPKAIFPLRPGRASSDPLPSNLPNCLRSSSHRCLRFDRPHRKQNSSVRKRSLHSALSRTCRGG